MKQSSPTIPSRAMTFYGELHALIDRRVWGGPDERCTLRRASCTKRRCGSTKSWSGVRGLSA